MSVTEINAVTGAGMTLSGGWSTDTSTAHSGAHAAYTATPGQTISGRFTFRDLHLLVAASKSGAVFDLAVDGGTAVRQAVQTTRHDADSSLGYRMLHPAAHVATDAGHDVVLTTVSGTLYVNAFLPITGAKLAANTGVLTCVGDSYTGGSGASNAALYYPNLLRMMMARRLRRNVTLTSTAASAIGSERLWGFSSANVGGHYRAYSVLSSDPSTVAEFITYLFGYNDIVGGYARPGDMFWNYVALLTYLGDVLDVTRTVKVAICTPPYVSPNIMAISEAGLNSGSGPKESIVDNYQLGVRAVRRAVSLFPWAKVADIHRAFDNRQSFQIPNTLGDYGIHPADGGHALIAHTIDHTFAGIAA